MLRLKSYIGLQTAEFCACVGSAGMLHARWFAGPRQCLWGGVPSASKIVLDQTDGCASVALVCCKVGAPPAAKGIFLFSHANKFCQKGRFLLRCLLEMESPYSV